MKKSFQISLGLLVSAIALYFAFRGVNFSELSQILYSAKLWPLIPFTAMWFAHYFLRALRWRYLLPKPPIQSQNEGAGVVSIRNLFDSIILGTLASFILPLRLGEFIRPLVLSRWTSYSFATGFASVVVERFFDLAAVLLSLACILPLLPALPPEAVVVVLPLGVLAIGLLGFIVFGCVAPDFVRKMISMFCSWMPAKIAGFVQKFGGDLLDAVSVVRSGRDLLVVVLLTVVVWATAYVQFYILFFMFPDSFSVLLGITMGVLVALFVAAPSSPGFVGVFQAGCVAAAAMTGYPTTTAQALSLILHAAIYILIVVVGFWLLSVHDLKLGELRSAATGAKNG